MELRCFEIHVEMKVRLGVGRLVQMLFEIEMRCCNKSSMIWGLLRAEQMPARQRHAVSTCLNKVHPCNFQSFRAIARKLKVFQLVSLGSSLDS